MKRNSRLYNSLLNVGTTAVVTLLSMILSMVVRSALNRSLGTDYVGLNGVLTSVISSLSIADLGVDSVFVYLLYKPMADHDREEIDKLMVLFKRVYLIIGSFFLLLGIACIPFLKYLVGHQAMSFPHVRLIFFIFLLNTGLSYFFAAYRIILNADQHYYIIARVTFIITVTTNLLQIAGLLFIKSFVLYSFLLLFNTVTTNLILGRLAIRRYGLRRLPKEHLRNLKFKNDKTVSTLVHNTIGGISNKLGGIFVNSSDNILLANFETLKIVGMYSNYLLVTNAVTSLLSKVLASLTATVGNLGAEGNERKNLDTFLKLTSMMNILVILCVIPMALFFGAFVNLWVGGNNILPELATMLIVINCMLSVARYPALTFIDAFGLQWIQRWKSIVESAVNIGVALFLLIVFKMGLVGVLLGTLCSNLLVVNWYEPYLVLREACGRHYREFIQQLIPAVVLFVLALAFSAAILHSGILGVSVWKSLAMIAVAELCLLAAILVFLRKNSGVQFIFRIFRRFTSKN